MNRYITLPNGRAVSLAGYVRAWRVLLIAPAEASVRGFGDWPEPAGAVLEELRRGLQDRINRHDRAYRLGRKWSEDWQRAAIQAARRVNTPRLVVGWIPAEFRPRLTARLASTDD